MSKKMIMTLATIGFIFLSYDILSAKADGTNQYGYNTNDKLTFKQCLDYLFGDNEKNNIVSEQRYNYTETKDLTESEMNDIIEQYFNSMSQGMPCH